VAIPQTSHGTDRSPPWSHHLQITHD